MSKKSLYHEEYDTYLKEARDLEDATYKAIDGIFNGYAEDGFSPIEISQIMINTIMTKESLYILERNRKMVAKNKREKNEF